MALSASDAALERLGTLALADFEPLVGEAFRCLDRPVELRLEKAEGCGEAVEGQRRPFSLLFGGPAEPLLAQAIQSLEHATLGRLDLFLVPVASDGAHAQYEAVFA